MLTILAAVVWVGQWAAVYLAVSFVVGMIKDCLTDED